MKKKAKIEVWWFDNDSFNHGYLLSLLSKNKKLKSRFDIKYFQSVYHELKREGTPEIIVVDTMTMTEHYVDKWERIAERTMLKFAEKHISSRFVISSAMIEWAWSIVDCLRLDLEDTVCTEVISEGARALYEYLENYAKKA